MIVNKFKLNIFLIISLVVIVLIFIFCDDDNLNSLVIDYNPDFIINEVNVVKEEVKNNVNNVVMINKVADTSKWVFPVSGNYVITTYYSYNHKAIDIYSYNGYGSAILAANNGVVSEVGLGCYRGDLSCNGRRGNYVVINHNKDNYYTVYMHLAEVKVKVGDVVTAGGIIGTMGNTGNVIPVPNATNPYLGTHLHFCLFVGEPYKGGYAINPFNLY